MSFKIISNDITKVKADVLAEYIKIEDIPFYYKNKSSAGMKAWAQ